MINAKHLKLYHLLLVCAELKRTNLKARICVQIAKQMDEEI